MRQMAHYRISTPLLMFTTNSMSMIHNNVGDLYMKKKTDSMARKYVLNSDLFPSEESLTKSTFFQVYRNWIRLLSEMAELEVMKGWHDHHEHMILDVNFTSLLRLGGPMINCSAYPYLMPCISLMLTAAQTLKVLKKHG